jgi:hypothetical protein
MDLSALFPNIPTPFFVRKVPRKRHWTDGKQSIIDSVLCPDEDGTVSLFRIADSLDLKRVSLALNANRVKTNPNSGSIREDLLLAAITDEELAGLDCQYTLGDTPCAHANHTHYDWKVASSNEVSGVVDKILSVQRPFVKISKALLVPAIAELEGIGCRAVTADSHCTACQLLS